VFVVLALCQALSGPSPAPPALLLEAARTGDKARVRALLASGTDVNASNGAGVTSLMVAAAAGHAGVVAALTDAGADLDQRDRLGRTALDRALAAGQDDVVRFLRARGAVGSGKSPGDTVCVERWAGSGFCGVIENADPARLRVRVTQVTGCADGCTADTSCSEGREVDASSVGERLWVSRSCLTRTFPGSGARQGQEQQRR
jgi:ankyrin repeat protein